MATQPTRRLWLWRPNLIVFVSSACIMILELVAGRIIAPQVGVSLYTWTSVIGVILAGISLGNYIGGRLADRYASLRLLGTMFLLAGVTSLAVLAIDRVNIAHRLVWPIIPEILVLITALFFVPATILGTISPIVVKLAMEDLASAGRTVGQISAFGSIGSITGTFITGFWLIARFGTYAVVWGVAVVLLALGALLFFARRRLRAAVSLVLIAVAAGVVMRVGGTRGPCLRETNYFCIKVSEEERDGELLRVLTLDRLVHSFSSLEHPTHLQYDYEQAYADLAAYQAAAVQPEHLRALFIGGGGYTFPRYMEAVYPESEIDVIEIDPGVTQTAYELLGLEADTEITSYNEDARLFLLRPVTRRYDLIYGDAFNDFSVPYHLTTREFNELVADWLTDDGVYIVNLIDGAQGRFLRAYVRTLRLTFDQVYVAPRLEHWRSVSRDTFIIAAGNSPLDLSAFADDAYFAQRVLDAAALEALLAEGRQVVLTDRYAPVEQMLAPVFLDKDS